MTLFSLFTAGALAVFVLTPVLIALVWAAIQDGRAQLAFEAAASANVHGAAHHAGRQGSATR
jgi:hypothetical protein